MKEPTYDITQHSTVHMDFSDYSFVAQPRYPIAASDPRRILRTFAGYTVAFFNRYLSAADIAAIGEAAAADSSVDLRLYQGRKR